MTGLQVPPVEYCPRSSTDGFASKSPSFSSALKKFPNLKASSSGRICNPAERTSTSKVLMAFRRPRTSCCAAAMGLRVYLNISAQEASEMNKASQLQISADGCTEQPPACMYIKSQLTPASKCNIAKIQRQGTVVCQWMLPSVQK